MVKAFTYGVFLEYGNNKVMYAISIKNAPLVITDIYCEGRGIKANPFGRIILVGQ